MDPSEDRNQLLCDLERKDVQKYAWMDDRWMDGWIDRQMTGHVSFGEMLSEFKFWCRWNLF